MATYQRPGVFINEQPAPAQPISSVSTSTAAFLGIAERGPANVAVKVVSWNDYVNKFALGLASAFYTNGYNAYGVYGFFNNGGTTMYQVRVTASGAVAASGLFTDGTATVLTFTAASAMDDNSSVADPGVWGNKLAINMVVNAVIATNYDVSVKLNNIVVETFKNCSVTATDANYIPNVINGISKYVSVLRSGTTPVQVSQLGVDKAFTGGADGLPVGTDFQTQLAALDPVQSNVAMIVCPDNQTSAFIQAAYVKAQAYNAFLITDGGLNDTVSTIQTLRGGLSNAFAEIHYPWIQVSDPISANKNAPVKYVPVAGHVAGAYARTDASRGTHKAPAGTIDGILNGALAVKTILAPADEDALNSNQINIIKSIKNVGVVIWGSRTLSATADMIYVPVRRELSKIELSAKAGTLWAVFEPNSDVTWRKISTGLRAYLFTEKEAGAFAGVKPDGSDSFYVICDATNNTSATINQGVINIQIGVAQVKPGEFVVINIGQAVLS